MDHRDELRAKKPAKACAADHENSRAAAIELHCETCIGSIHEAAQCPALKCFLWPYRPGTGSATRLPGAVPTVDEYAEMRPTLTDEERAAVRARFLGEQPGTISHRTEARS